MNTNKTNFNQVKTLQDVIDMIDNQFNADNQLKTFYKGFAPQKPSSLYRFG